MNIAQLVTESHRIAIDHGFWDEECPTPTCLALIHSEVSEALEADRMGDIVGFAEEMADTVIRVCDLCGQLGINLEAAIERKTQINRDRPRKHGKAY